MDSLRRRVLIKCDEKLYRWKSACISKINFWLVSRKKLHSKNSYFGFDWTACICILYVVLGEIPKWLKGTLIRNGPGSLKVGSECFAHLFDSSALLHRFHIVDGQITYQCKFIETNVYKTNQAAQRIVLTDFGTVAVPDPCQTTFQKYFSSFYFLLHIIFCYSSEWQLYFNVNQHRTTAWFPCIHSATMCTLSGKPP